MTTLKEIYEAQSKKDDTFVDLDGLLSEFDDLYAEGGADPAGEDDDCVGGACKL